MRRASKVGSCLIASLLLAVLPCTSTSQATFQRAYGTGSSEFAEAVLQMSDGGFLVGGQTNSEDPNFDLLLFKTDSLGGLQWSRAIGGASEDRLCHAIVIAPDTALLVGFSRSYSSAGDRDAWILAVTTRGEVLWSRTYGGVEHEVAQYVEQTSDGGFIVAGHVGSFQDVLLFRLDKAGQLLWARRYGGRNTDVGMAVTQIAEGGFVVAGWTYNYGAGAHDALLLKTDSLGVLRWARTYGTWGDEGAHRVLRLDGDDYLVLGNSSSMGPGLFLMRTDSSGALLWTRSYPDMGEQILSSMVETADGDVVLSGSIGVYGSLTGYSFLMKTDTAASARWCWAFPFSKADLRVHDARQTSDGGYVGAANVYRKGPEDPDIFLVKTDPKGHTGCFNQMQLYPAMQMQSLLVTSPDIPDTAIGFPSTDVAPRVRAVSLPVQDACALTGTGQHQKAIGENALDNYPNPFNPSTTVRFWVASSGTVSLKVYDVLGREVQVLVEGYREAGEYSVNFTGGELAGGVYFCRLEAGSTALLKKMVLLR